MRLLERFVKTEYASYEDFFDNYKVNVPENFNFCFDIVDEMARLAPEQRALVWCNDKGDERFFSFREISELANKAANALKALGIKKGDVVMVLLKRRYQYWYVSLALNALGALLVPATHLLTRKDIDYRIQKAGVKMIISALNEDEMSHIIEALKDYPEIINASVGGSICGALDMDRLIDEAPYAPLPRVTTKDDLFCLYFTSGTTAYPKIVAHKHDYPLGHILTGCYWQNLKDTDLHLTLADTGWAKTSWGKIYGQWIAGAAVFVYDYENKFTPVDVLKVITKYRITTFCAPPTIFRFLIKENLSGYDFSSLRACYIAGEPLNAEVYRQWLELTGIELREGFGQTETTVLVATFPWLKPKPGSMGKPSPCYGIKILDDNGEECGIGQEGELCISIKDGSPVGLFVSYYNDEDKLSSVMYDSYYHTNDVAWKDEDGYLWFVG